ncbi:MAG: AAA domain-containing protein [Gammaproteobacteria bacterium]|nr:AAA domain-containing protein [Gammaproteobacteria bacterium]
MSELDVQQVATLAERVLDEVELAVIGKRGALEMMLLSILSDGHILIEDFPGLAKTLMARSFAQVTDLAFNRVQFTPDLMPMDVTGSMVLGASRELEFRRGPVFTNLLLADEVNRAPAKTQAALLEAMQERQVTVDGVTHLLDRPFIVVATQNPIEYEGTYPLPEAQLDRFLMRLSVGYPEPEDEWRILEDRMERRSDDIRLDVVIDGPTLRGMQRAVERVHVSEPVGKYIVELVRSTRTRRRAQVGASPRGSLAVMKLSRARAAVDGRDFVTPDDVKHVAIPALAHRIILRPELWVQDVRGEDVVKECLDTVPTPPSVPRDE